MLYCAISDININKNDSAQMHVLEVECARYEKVSAKSRDSVSCALPVSTAARAESDDFLAVAPIHDKAVIERSVVTLLLGNFLRFMGCLRSIRATRRAISNL